MEAIFAPFKSTMFQAGEQVLAAQKQMIAWQRSQLELAEQQAATSMKMGKAGFDASAELAQNVSKSMVAAFAPKAETPAS